MSVENHAAAENGGFLIPFLEERIMITKYNTGDVVLIPCTIQSAELLCGEVAYRIREFPETSQGSLLISESTIVGTASPKTKVKAPEIVNE